MPELTGLTVSPETVNLFRKVKKSVWHSMHDEYLENVCWRAERCQVNCEQRRLREMARLAFKFELF